MRGKQLYLEFKIYKSRAYCEDYPKRVWLRCLTFLRISSTHQIGIFLSELLSHKDIMRIKCSLVNVILRSNSIFRKKRQRDFK